MVMSEVGEEEIIMMGWPCFALRIRESGDQQNSSEFIDTHQKKRRERRQQRQQQPRPASTSWQIGMPAWL
jgi:hypothetical protein